MSPFSNKNVSDFQVITGLTEQIARECFDAFDNYAVALASFAQSYSALPAEYFSSRNAVTENAKAINDELRAIYSCAREMKKKSRKSDKEVWKNYGKEETSLPVKQLKNPFISGTSGGSVFSIAEPNTTNQAAVGTTNIQKGESGFKMSTFPATTSIFPAPPSISSGAKQPAKLSPSAFGFGQTLNSIPAASGTTGNTSTTTTVCGSGFEGLGKLTGTVNNAFKTDLPKKKTAEESPATHYTGPFFDLTNFWEEEVVKEAPLFNLNNGFMELNKNEMRPRMEKWLKRAEFYRKPIKYLKINNPDEEVVRVIIKDADRTFFHPEHRAKLVSFLHALTHEFNAYAQSMSYLSALCMLTLSEEETASIIRFVSTEYIKGHWAAEAVGFATSAWVVEYFMQKKFPRVAKHLNSLNLWPDTYLQKILTGLCIHVLPFTELFEFLDAFMVGGLRYLIRFCLALIERFQDKILAIQSSVEANTLYDIMRLERNIADRNDIRAILKRAPLIDLGEDEEIDAIRCKVYEEKVAPRLHRAPKVSTFEPCALCEERRPEWWNDDLGAVCSQCKAANPREKYEIF